MLGFLLKLTGNILDAYASPLLQFYIYFLVCVSGKFSFFTP